MGNAVRLAEVAALLLLVAGCASTAEVFLLGAFLPQAGMLLVLLYPSGWFSGWDTGAWMILVVCALYLARAIAISLPGTPGDFFTQP